MLFMKKYLESIKSFLPITICFIVIVLCVKCFELFTSDSIKISHVAEMVYSNLIASLFFLTLFHYSQKKRHYIHHPFFFQLLLFLK